MTAFGLPLTTDELDAMRADFAVFFTDTATVSRRVAVRTTTGATSTAYQVAGSYPCRVAPYWFPERESVIGGGLTSVSTVTLDVPWDADIRAGDQVEVTGPGHTAPIVLEVTSPRIANSSNIRRVVPGVVIGAREPAPAPTVSW